MDESSTLQRIVANLKAPPARFWFGQKKVMKFMNTIQMVKTTDNDGDNDTLRQHCQNSSPTDVSVGVITAVNKNLSSC